MLYHLSPVLRQAWSAFNVFHYITFRSGAALLTSLLCTLAVGPSLIGWLGRCFSSAARPYTPEAHKLKGSTPIMGGLLIGLGFIVSMALWANWTNVDVWFFVGTLVLFGAIGFLDDWCKVKYKKGISITAKLVTQLSAALFIGLAWYVFGGNDTSLWFPFLKNIHPDLGILSVVWTMVVLIGASNAVNLTDGLDGLATTSLVANFMTFAFICYAAGHITIAAYLALPFVQTAELTVAGAALVGALLGFLWFNTYPAQVFMGDVGALALGAGLGFMAIASKQELLLLISGGLFVVEALSVMIQIAAFRIWGTRVFKTAPLHHHYEILGWPEAKITVRFGIISFVLCLLVLMTLKVR